MTNRQTVHVKRLLARLLAVLAGCGLTGVGAASASAAYLAPPHPGGGVTVQWYWQIGGGTLPSMTSGTASTANIWDTDMFADATTLGPNDDPNAPSKIVSQLHAADKYSVCYIEAGAQQDEPDQSHFVAADYTNGPAQTTEMQGWPGEYWFNTLGFSGWTPAHQAYSGSTADQAAAANIAAGMAQRIAGCKTEGQDAIEPDDLDGYTNPSQTGAGGGGWGLTQAAAEGYEQWLAYTAHTDGLAIFQKNDPANSSANVGTYDGMIIEECNAYDDPCAGSGGDGTPYLSAGKPVLNAEYTQDGETTSKFCASDTAAGISGALFDVDLAGGTYNPCQTGAGYAYTGPVGSLPPSGGTPPPSPSGGSAGQPPAAGSKPVNSARPVVHGTAAKGSRLTATGGSWRGTPTRYAYGWERCKSTCATVHGATKSTYTLVAADVGYQLIAVVTATNTAGSTSAKSQPTARIVSNPHGVAAKRGRRSGTREPKSARHSAVPGARLVIAVRR